MSAGPLQIARFHDSAIRDERTRQVFREVYDHIRALQRLLKPIVGTSYGKGIVRLVPRIVTQDPTEVSTFGEVGELVQFKGTQFSKLGIQAEDKNWGASASKADTIPVTFSSLKPTGTTSGVAFHVQSQQATNAGDILWIKLQKGNGNWEYISMIKAKKT